MIEVIFDWQTRARMFILKQRIRELENAVERWPNSQKYEARKAELAEKQEELREYEVGYV